MSLGADQYHRVLLVLILAHTAWGIPGGTSGKEPTCLSMQETKEMQVQSLGGEDPLEEGTATRSSILAVRIPWTEGPGGLQSGSERARHD